MTVPHIRYENIFGNISQQKQVVEIFLKIDEKRTRMRESLLPGGELIARTRAHLFTFNGLCRREIC